MGKVYWHGPKDSNGEGGTVSLRFLKGWVVTDTDFKKQGLLLLIIIPLTCFRG